MGLNQFLSEVLPTSGRRINLEKIKDHKLRLAIDVSTWIVAACQGHGDMLGDERHLTNQGRAALQRELDEKPQEGSHQTLQERIKMQNQLHFINACAVHVLERVAGIRSTGHKVLVVFDGATPPVKQGEVGERKSKRAKYITQRDDPRPDGEDEDARVKAFRRAGAGKHYGAVLDAIIEKLRDEQIPFLVAPYEADGQLAFLLQAGYVDLVATEDSDLTAYMAGPILYKLSSESSADLKSGIVRGFLLRPVDLAASGSKFDFLDFTPAMMAVLFVAAGSDYCRKLGGIGIKRAFDLVRVAFLVNTTSEDPLAEVFRGLFEQCNEANLDAEAQKKYQEDFLAALIMFRHPTIFDPVRGCCRFLNDNGDAELLRHKPYARLFNDIAEREAIVGRPHEPELAISIAEGRISAKTLQPRDDYQSMSKPDA